MVLLLVTRWWKKEQIRLCVFFSLCGKRKPLAAWHSLGADRRAATSLTRFGGDRQRRREQRKGTRVTDGQKDRKKERKEGREKESDLVSSSILGCGKGTGIMAAKTQGKMVSLKTGSKMKKKKRQLLMTFIAKPREYLMVVMLVWEW